MSAWRVLIFCLLFPHAVLALEEPAELVRRANYAVIFKGPTICEGCEKPFVEIFKSRGLAVRFAKSGESTAQLLRHAAIYVVPGGEDVQNPAQAWTERERKALRDYLAAGGRYYGVCLGGYWAADWPGEIKGFTPLAVVPAHVSAHSPTKEPRMERVSWKDKSRFVYFQDGPSFAVTDPKAEIFATYDDGSVAAFVSPYGLGKVAVSGVHTEATAEWLTEDHLQDPDGPDRDLAEDILNALMR